MNPSACLFALALLTTATAAHAQDRAPQLNLTAGMPGGARTFVTDAPGVMNFTVQNPTAADRDGRVVVYFAERPDLQYARDVWVPARSSMEVWLPVGPAPGPPVGTSRELRLLLYDRVGDADRRILPSNDDRFRSRPVIYRKRAPTTAVLADSEGPDTLPRDWEVVRFARAARLAIDLPTPVSVVPEGPLPPTPETLDGVDVLAVAGNRLAADPPGRAVVRRWVEHGGTLWVMLDRTDPATVAAVLGDDLDLTVVGPASLTTVRVGRPGANPADAEVRTEERPVGLARAVPGGADRVLAEVDGWPAAFVRRVGRGKVVFTALGGRGWFRPRVTDLVAGQPIDPRRPIPKGKDPASPDPDTPDLPVPLPHLAIVAGELHPSLEDNPLPADLLRPLLNDDIGYAVVDRGTAAAVLGGFVLSLVGLGVGLRQGGRPELAGWAGAGAAVVTAGLFVGLGDRSRQAVPPTAAAVGFADPVPGTGDIVTTGLYAMYRPESGPLVLGTRTGSEFDLDPAGLDGQTRRRVQADVETWAWDGVSIPAGTRTGGFRATVAGRVGAVARFGPNGVDGRLDAGPYTEAGDAVILTPAGDPLPVRLAADGTFAVGPDDALPPGQYLAGAVLTDRQQRRQEVYRRLFAGPLPRHLRNRDLLFTWATSPDLPVTPDAGARAVGSALVSAPLAFEPVPAGTRVVVPRGFVVGRRVTATGLEPLMATAPFAVDMRLRFQVPPTALPLTVEKAVFTARFRPAGRRVTVTAGTAVVFDAVGPTDPVRVELTDPAVLRPDAGGALYLNVAIGKPPEGSDAAWAIDSLGLELTGVTEERR